MDGRRYDNDDLSPAPGPDYRRHRVPLRGTGPLNYRRSDDRIFEEVCEVLLHSPDVDASHITVRVSEGEVFLEGSVINRFNKRLAEYLIEDLPGVIDVRNDLQIEKDYNYYQEDA